MAPFSPQPLSSPGAAAGRPGKIEYGALGVALGAVAGLAFGHAADPVGSSTLQGKPALDVAALALGVAGIVLPKVLEADSARPRPGRFSDCRCDPAATCTDTLNGFDRAVRQALVASPGRRQFWSEFSDVTLVAGLARPFALIAAAESDPGERGRATLVYVEAEVLALGVNGAVKHFFHRPRPYAHFGVPPDPEALEKEDSRLSFFSGHATASFAAAVTAGRLADLRGYDNRAWIWGTGLSVALASSVARIASDRHYATDVLVGVAIGSACGWAIPKLHERELSDDEARAGGPQPAGGPFASPGPAISIRAPLLGKSASVGLGPWADGVGALVRLGW